MPEQPDNAALLDSLAPLLHDKRLAASPILHGCPPSEYLRPFLTDAPNPLPFKGGIDRFFSMGSAYAGVLSAPLTQEGLRIIDVMHAEKKLRHKEFISMQQDALLSVIMPTRDRPEALEGPILSVIAQSYKNWELLVINDGGGPEAEAVIKRFKDERIRYLHNAEPYGAAQARNNALAEARGSHIAYLDDDYQWDPDFLLILYGELVKHKRRFIYSAQMVWQDFDPDSNLGRQFLVMRYVPFNRSYIENNNFISIISCMHEKSLCDEAGGFNPSMKSEQDWEFFLRLAEVTDPMETPCILSHYYMYRYTQNVTTAQGSLPMYHRTVALLQGRAAWQEKLSSGDNKSFTVASLSTSLLRRRQHLYRPEQAAHIKIIVSHNDKPDLLQRCLASLSEQTTLPHDICIVNKSDAPLAPALVGADAPAGTDNASKVKDYGDSVSEVYDFREALEQEKAGTDEKDVIVLTSSRAVFTPNWLEELLLLFSRFPDAGMAVPRCVLPPRHQLISVLVPQRIASFEADISLSINNVLRPNIAFEGYFELAYPQGFSAVAMPASLVRELGKEMEDAFTYEDINSICPALIKKHDKKIYYSPFSKIYYLPDATTPMAT